MDGGTYRQSGLFKHIGQPQNLARGRDEFGQPRPPKVRVHQQRPHPRPGKGEGKIRRHEHAAGLPGFGQNQPATPVLKMPRRQVNTDRVDRFSSATKRIGIDQNGWINVKSDSVQNLKGLRCGVAVRCDQSLINGQVALSCISEIVLFGQ